MSMDFWGKYRNLPILNICIKSLEFRQPGTAPHSPSQPGTARHPASRGPASGFQGSGVGVFGAAGRGWVDPVTTQQNKKTKKYRKYP